MEWIAAARTDDHRRQADGNTKQANPAGEKLAHGPPGGLQIKSEHHPWQVNQDGRPQNPAAAANLDEPLV